MTDPIPAIKSKSKIKPLQEEIQSLEYQNEVLLEEMYENGLRTRPSIMTQIEDREENTLQSILYIIKECEKETGRLFPYGKPI